MRLPASLVPWSRLNRRFMAIALSDALAYRGTFLLGAVFSLLPLATSLLLWIAIYRSGGQGLTIAGFDLNAMLSYYLVQYILGIVNTAEVEWDVTQQIRNGTLNTYLMRPLSYAMVRWDMMVAGIAVAAVLAVAPAALLFFAARPVLILPAAGWQWGAFLLAVVLGVHISFLMSLCLGWSAFWFLETSGFMQATFPFQMVLSGWLFPLELLPRAVWAVAGNLPWTYMTYFPLQIWLGRLDPAAVLRGFAFQAFWIAALFALAAFLWRRGIRRYEAVGG